VSIDNSINIPQGAYVDRSAGEMIVAEQRRQGRRLEKILNNGYLNTFVSDALSR
jgi:hypothetical protein